MLQSPVKTRTKIGVGTNRILYFCLETYTEARLGVGFHDHGLEK